jgi:hypothetical protein
MKKFFALTALSAGLLAAGAASAATVSYDLNTNPSAAYGPGYTFATTNWSQLLSLPQFNIANATLNSATLTYQGGFTSNGQIDSEDAEVAPTIVSTAVTLKFRGNGTNGSTNLGGLSNNLSLAGTLFDGDLAADGEPGLADFIGDDSASGLTTALESAANSFAITNLAAVTGAGNFSVWAQAISGLTIQGTANLSTQILTDARAKIAVTYDYTLLPPPPPPPPGDVPEPAILAMLGLGLAGMSAVGRKRKSA